MPQISDSVIFPWGSLILSAAFALLAAQEPAERLYAHLLISSLFSSNAEHSLYDG